MKKKNMVLIMIFMIIISLSFNVSAAEKCYEVVNTIQEDVGKILKWAAPILMVIFTSIDLAKVVFQDNKDSVKKIKDNFLKRFVALLIVFFATDIVTFFLGLVDIEACVNPNENQAYLVNSSNKINI